MCWTRVFVLSLLTALLVLTISSVVDGAAVRYEAKADEPKVQEQEVLVPEPDVSNFFKHRSRRSLEYYRELQAERARSAGTDSRSRYYEQQRRDYEQYLEEERSERYERARQYQWRMYHYGGYYPQYYYWHQ